jgi:hypothetical protein
MNDKKTKEKGEKKKITMLFFFFFVTSLFVPFISLFVLFDFNISSAAVIELVLPMMVEPTLTLSFSLPLLLFPYFVPLVHTPP